MRALSFDLLVDVLAAPENDDADDDLRRERLRRAVRLAFEKELTPRQQRCLELCVVQGMGLARAGEELGISAQAVWRHVQAARRRLARVLRYCMVML